MKVHEIIALLFLSITWGCSSTNVKYTAFCKNKIPPVDHATIVEGRFDLAKPFFEQAQLPHNLGRARVELVRQGVGALTSQLGANDYVLIGEVFGGGNARANLEGLKAELARRAAKERGDVVLLIDGGVQARPYAFTTPGYAYTNSYASVYAQGNTAYGTGTAYTTVVPGQTYAGVVYLPHADGLVFKYVPGVERRWKLIMALPDDKLQSVMAQLASLPLNKSITFEEQRHRADQVLTTAGIVVK